MFNIFYLAADHVDLSLRQNPFRALLELLRQTLCGYRVVNVRLSLPSSSDQFSVITTNRNRI